jgi:hypothetical protein
MTVFSKLKPGIILYDCHTYGMGNTTMRAMGCWDVEVVSVDASNRTAVVKWNGNQPQVYRIDMIRKLRENPPEWLRNPLDGDRCHFCYAKRTDGVHAQSCHHPKAISARKKATK